MLEKRSNIAEKIRNYLRLEHRNGCDSHCCTMDKRGMLTWLLTLLISTATMSKVCLADEPNNATSTSTCEAQPGLPIWVNALGFTNLVLGISASLPQAYKLWKDRDFSSFSRMSLLISVVTALSGVTYTIFLGNPFFITGSIYGALYTIYVLYGKRYLHRDPRAGATDIQVPHMKMVEIN